MFGPQDVQTMSTALEDVCKILNLADEAKRAACNLRSGSRPGNDRYLRIPAVTRRLCKAEIRRTPQK